MISGVSCVNFTGCPSKMVGSATSFKIKDNGEYIRGFRGVMDGFLTPEKLAEEECKAVNSANFSFIQGVNDAIAKLKKNIQPEQK